MRFRRSLVARAAALALACCAAMLPPVRAQSVGVSTPVIAGERLSDWLLRSAGPNADLTALHWRVVAEQAAQGRLRQAVVQLLLNDGGIRLSNEARAQLADWLQQFPLTGRLPLAVADARWLQAAPVQDPILQQGHQVLLLPRPLYVTVVGEDGQPCRAAHRSGAHARDYVLACLSDPSGAQVDRIWVAQADGRTAHYGIAPWSLEPQDEPGPGAWIWAPRRSAAIPDSVSDNLARFLATQFPGEFMPQSDQWAQATLTSVDPQAPRAAPVTASDWGEIGLLQTPTARMAAVGDVRLQISHATPYTRGTVMLQPLDWLEAGFRYTDISNRLYGPAIAGNQSFKDKSIDFKLRLREESHSWPQLALGVRDLGGTGLFSGEYAVASKRWGNWDASLGIGWGYLGARGNIRNPFSLLSDRFNTRPGASNLSGGTVNLRSMFRGPAALFGGVQWQSPYDPLVLKLELDGNDYQHEPLANNQRARSPINIGAVYRYSPNLDFSLALERGNRLMLGFTLHGGLDRIYAPKLLDRPLPPLRVQAPQQLSPQGWGGTAALIEVYTGWSVRAISHQHVTTTVVAETDGAIHLQERVERALQVLHRDAPASITRFVLELQEHGLASSRIEIDRAEWLALRTRAEPPAERLPEQQRLPGQALRVAVADGDEGAGASWQGKGPGLSVAWGPSYSQILGGPNNFLLYQIGAQAWAEQRFSDDTWISAGVNLRLLDNYGNFSYTAASKLPRVRTFQREFVTASRLTLPVLQLTHVGDLGGGHYLSGYAGMLEPMYGGFGAEWLYRPWQGRLAWGVDINHVRQRDFRQNLAFRDYSVNTGHATMYWDTGWNDIQLNLSVGRYLAGDRGATLEVKRTFANGVAIGAWATKTTVSTQQFGEGSFDKGIYASIPFDVMLPKSSPGVGAVVWNPLTRDGGARLGRQFPLYELTRQRDARAWKWRSASPHVDASADDTSYVLSEPPTGGLARAGSSLGLLGHQLAEVPASTWLWAGGAVLATSLLDTRTDRWAAKHQDGNWQRAGNASNALPYVLALGAGLLYTGIAGEAASSTAETAIKAAAVTYGVNLATRWAVGRARPNEGLGNHAFEGLTRRAASSSFASGHVAAAFALATPFAQEHDMPWLYAVAAASAFGRVQKREHWLSDTAAGAFMGYAVGSLFSDQLKGNSNLRVNIAPNGVGVDWTFK